MPNPKICNRIADPAARRRCLEYKGEFAEPAAGPVRPAAAPRPGAGRLGSPVGGRMGRLAGGRPRRRGPRGGGFGGGGRGGY